MMMKVLVFFVAFHLLLHKAAVNAEYAPFGFFKLILQWPPSLCNKKRCQRPPPDDFMIHGLWPNNFTGGLLKKCYNKAYDDSVMSEYVVQQLKFHWPNIQRGTDEKYWKHEWRLHGVCSLVWYDQELYFYLAIQLRKRYMNLKPFMISKGIVPGFNYTFKEIGYAVEEFTTKIPDLTCNYDKDKKFQLNDVRLCFTPGGTILDCPTDRSSTTCTAHDHIYFPLPL